MSDEVRTIDGPLLGRAFAAGSRATASMALVASLVVALVFAASDSGLPILLKSSLLVATLACLGLLVWTRSWMSGVAYLVVGSFAVWAYVGTFAPYVSENEFFDVIAVTLPHVALVLVGSPRRRLGDAAIWNTAGYLAGTAAGVIALLGTGEVYPFWSLVTYAYALSLVLLTLAWIGNRRDAFSIAPIRQAAHDEVAATARARVEAKAAALLHDTVLSHLAAIAHAPDGPLDPDLARQIEYDRATILGEGWLSESSTSSTLVAEWEDSVLYRAVTEVERSGLTVELSGDPLAALRLPSGRLAELSLAVKQCLVNVRVHSGQDRAEVAVHAADDSVIVMVIDTGRGFDEAAVGSDRFGISGSVRGRIDRLGGSTQIWSTPGEGTSIILDVPLEATAPLEATRPMSATPSFEERS
ncbi:sensor histidine kinase [Marisediminicola sp. LYQ134]|uniref:sensor histidine kinase n=1 Tax=unclassified Marisediminicola TaxID=2618316 RepID=UPI003982E382